MMRRISTEAIGTQVRELFLASARLLPAGLRDRLAAAREAEPSPQGRAILDTIIGNASIAASGQAPLCQDTGLAQVVIELGQEVALEGPPLQEAVELGMRQAYESGFLRKSTCHPLERRNLGDNGPASLETIIVPGDIVDIRTLAKGGGCDNKSRLLSLPPTSSRDQLVRAIVGAVLEAGPDACPPFCLGVAVGGSFESAPRLARRALIDLWRDPPMSPEEEGLASETLSGLNASGLGPMGLGGRTTALGMRLKLHPTHLASLPVAVNVNCHSLRTGRAVL
jgi:fumarate hydratase subunit alpha